MDRQRYLVSPVAKALRVLDAVAECPGLGVSAVAERLKLPKTTVFRYLCTLEAAEYVVLDEPRDSYRVGPRFAALVQPGDAIQALRAQALPIMTALRDRFDETINLGVLRGPSVVYVEIVESSQRLRLQARVGGEDPAHSTALGRAILARLPAAERAQALPHDLSQRTAKTIRSSAALNAVLRRVALLGYAVERGENEAGAVCVGAAVLDGTSRPVAALSLAAPEFRMPERRIAEAGAALAQAAALVRPG